MGSYKREETYEEAFCLLAAAVALFAMILAGCDAGDQKTLNEQEQTYPRFSRAEKPEAAAVLVAVVIGWNVWKTPRNCFNGRRFRDLWSAGGVLDTHWDSYVKGHK
ncbi:MAG: hypothetical protein LBG43_03650 [Treponema sp.]|jgi:hypothetical protein|nr:hypothetical protein [Treponema sp.]